MTTSHGIDDRIETADRGTGGSIHVEGRSAWLLERAREHIARQMVTSTGRPTVAARRQKLKSGDTFLTPLNMAKSGGKPSPAGKRTKARAA